MRSGLRTTTPGGTESRRSESLCPRQFRLPLHGGSVFQDVLIYHGMSRLSKLYWRPRFVEQRRALTSGPRLTLLAWRA
jgi:hypothetical protein